jgi:hypothetical protein
VEEVYVLYKQEDEVGGYMGAPPGPRKWLGVTSERALAEKFKAELSGKFRSGYLSYGFLTLPMLSEPQVDELIRRENFQEG